MDQLLQEWICSAFGADGGGWSVAGNDPGFVGEGQQAGVDGVDDLLEVAAGQVGAADAAGKERVAGEDHLERSEVKADGALGVAGGVQDLGWVSCRGRRGGRR